MTQAPVEDRMSADALELWKKFSKSKSDAVVKKALAAISEAGLRNRNGRIFLETVRAVTKS